ncbi:outer membrane protein assembly factor BamD [Xaviernesmea oryzae]|uniref:hypothetical protein n=1 Tax=Xaviernesmea oryzae TaxID=464029 RepID=UPI0011138043|nr:hypothetical protein [Xaviernesmea oryzae]
MTEKKKLTGVCQERLSWQRWAGGLALASLGASLSTTSCSAGPEPSHDRGSTGPATLMAMNPAGDPDEAVQREFSLIERRGTVEAYERFIRRHPRHPLAEEARRRLRTLAPD